MKKSLAIALLSLVVIATGLSAQSIKIATVDMAVVMQKYYKSTEATERLQESVERQNAQIQEVQEEGQAMLDEFNELRAQTENEALSDAAREEAQAAAEAKARQIQEKQNELRELQQNAQRILSERRNNFRLLLLEEIREVVYEVGQSHGATLILDTSAPDNATPSDVLFAEPSWSITDEVLEVLNRDAPPPADS